MKENSFIAGFVNGIQWLAEKVPQLSCYLISENGCAMQNLHNLTAFRLFINVPLTLLEKLG